MPRRLETKLNGVVLLSSIYDPTTDVDEPLLSERDKRAPRLTQIADTLPF